MKQEKSLNILFGISIYLIISCIIDIIIMFAKMEFLVSFYYLAGFTFLFSGYYIVKFIIMRNKFFKTNYDINNTKTTCNNLCFIKTSIETTNSEKQEDFINLEKKANEDIKTNNKEKLIQIIDDFQKINFLIANFIHLKTNNMSLCEFDKLLSEYKFSPIDFARLTKDSKDKYKLNKQQEYEQDELIKGICVPLKRAGYLDSANKVYKYIYQTYGFSQVLMNSWAKIFVCNKQFDIAYRLFELGDNHYKYRIQIGDLKLDSLTMLLLGGIVPSECAMHMKDIKKAMNDSQYAFQLVKDMGGNPNITLKIKLD